MERELIEAHKLINKLCEIVFLKPISEAEQLRQVKDVLRDDMVRESLELEERWLG